MLFNGDTTKVTSTGVLHLTVINMRHVYGMISIHYNIQITTFTLFMKCEDNA